MGNSRDKAEEYMFWEQNNPIQRINNIITPIQACDIINQLILKHDFSKEDMNEIETLKEWIKSR